MQVTLSEVIDAIEALVPLSLAEDWDRTGFQLGDPTAAVDSIVVALEPSIEAVKTAADNSAQLLVTHHPLLLKPPGSIDLSTSFGRLLRYALKNGISVYSAHTNLDRLWGGVSDVLAQRIGLGPVEPLSSREPMVKLVVTVPAGYEGRVSRSLVSSGAGQIGAYAGCMFSSRGVGEFTPLAGSRPFQGTEGVREATREVRIETVAPKSRLGAMISSLRMSHPYEEPAIDVYPLLASHGRAGLGRIGSLPAPVELEEWAPAVAKSVRARCARLIGGRGASPISRVAVCGGSGGSLWEIARKAGADILVTGDVRYHTAVAAAAEGMPILDVGHAASEWGAVDAMVGLLTDWTKESGAEVSVVPFYGEEPYSWVAA